ncbi:MAG: Rpn family recombination-promoting nuclease/putative transposase, partial [Acidobacteriota bacterium]
MGLRSAVYAGMLCQDLVRARQLPSRGRLPRVVVLVLYNGQRPWTAPHRVEELFESAPVDMKECSLRFGYLLVEERAFSLDELGGRRNAAAIVFRLEKSRTPEQIRQVVEDVLDWFPGEEHQSLRHSLAT